MRTNRNNTSMKVQVAKLSRYIAHDNDKFGTTMTKEIDQTIEEYTVLVTVWITCKNMMYVRNEESWFDFLSLIYWLRFTSCFKSLCTHTPEFFYLGFFFISQLARLDPISSIDLHRKLTKTCRGKFICWMLKLARQIHMLDAQIVDSYPSRSENLQE